MLTGKAKQDFWCSLSINELQDFYTYSDVIQNALIIEWFDSVGIYIEIAGANYSGIEFWYNIQQQGTINGNNGDYFKTRQEATQKSINKANEIYNKYE